MLIFIALIFNIYFKNKDYIKNWYILASVGHTG
jgi:hypothetical protein